MTEKGKGKVESPTPPSNSLSSIVSSLVRAQHGISKDQVADEDLDRHVADLLIKEAQERQKSWGQIGYKAYFEDDEASGPTHKTNKRFLNSILRNVDDHNQALIRQENEGAKQRADEAVEKEREEYRRWREKSKGKAKEEETRPVKDVKSSEDQARSSRLFGKAFRQINVPSKPREKVEESQTEENKHNSAAAQSKNMNRETMLSDEREFDVSPSKEEYTSRHDHDRRSRDQDIKHDRSSKDYESLHDIEEQTKEEKKRRRRSHSPDDSSRHRTSRHEPGSHSDQTDRSPEKKSTRERNADGEGGRHRDRERHRDRDRSWHRDRNERYAEEEEEERAERSRRRHEREERYRQNGPDEETDEEKRERRRERKSREERRRERDSERGDGDRYEEERERKRRREDRVEQENRRSTSPKPSEAHYITNGTHSKSEKISSFNKVLPPSDDEDDTFIDHSFLQTAAAGPSKMDKYFDVRYDPKLDISIDDLTDSKTGLIANGNFDEWNNMLETIKLRKEYRKEKEEREREEAHRQKELERLEKESKAKRKAEAKERKKAKAAAGIINLDREGFVAPPEVAPTKKKILMDIQGFTKRSTVREWDLAKETPT